jgi:hypothetical protein
LRNIKIGNKFACSKKFGSIKAKNTFVENYGVEHPLKIEEFRKKQAKAYVLNYLFATLVALPWKINTYRERNWHF